MPRIKRLAVVAIGILLLLGVTTLLLGPHHLLSQGKPHADSFHPPSSWESDKSTRESYKEWHYFNIIDDEQGVSFIGTITIGGDLSSERSMAGVVMSCMLQDKSYTSAQNYPISMAEWSKKRPDVRVSTSSVSLEKDGYHVCLESGEMLLNAVFRPSPIVGDHLKAERHQGFVMNWFAAAPKMSVDGSLTVCRGNDNEKTYRFSNARGYHDHNWGNWYWKDNFSWDWAQSSGEYSFTFFSVGGPGAALPTSLLEIWKGDERIGVFRDQEITIKRDGMVKSNNPEDGAYPSTTTLIAKNQKANIQITFKTERFEPIPVYTEIGKRVIWELYGKFHGHGIIDDRTVEFANTGFVECFN